MGKSFRNIPSPQKLCEFNQVITCPPGPQVPYLQNGNNIVSTLRVVIRMK